MTIKKALTKYSKVLKTKNIPSPCLDVEMLLSYVLKKPKEYLYTYTEKIISAEKLRGFRSLIIRRCKGEPVAYLTNHKEFFGINFYVDKRVLIPRPETEMLVEEVVKAVSGKLVSGKLASGKSISDKSSSGRSAVGRRLAICDIGTGSGCIAIALAKHLPNVKLIATDISKAALAVAKKNARRHTVYNKIKFLHGHLLESVKVKPDIIVANLPYIETKKLKRKVQNSLAFEPKQALDGWYDGLYFYRQLFDQIKAKNYCDLTVLIEINPEQNTQLRKYIKKLFPQNKIETKMDLAGRLRMVKIKL